MEKPLIFDYRKTVLMLFAHPDDETLFGYPLMQFGKNGNRHLIVMSDNRPKYPEAVRALEGVCGMAGVHYYSTVGLESNFYRSPCRIEDKRRTPELKHTLVQNYEAARCLLKLAIEKIKPNAIFTHNPLGEYGHGDHKLTFNLAMETGLPIFYTDICFYDPAHVSYSQIPCHWKNTLIASACGREFEVERDEKLYRNAKYIYQQFGAWSYDDDTEVPRKARICGIDIS